MSSKTCLWVEQNLMAYLHGGLAADGQQAIQQHVLTCTACAQKLLVAQTVQSRLFAEAAASQVSLSPQAGQRIREQVQREMRTGAMLQRTLKLARGVYSLASLAIVIALIVFALLWMMRLRPQPAAQPISTGSPTSLPVIPVVPSATLTPTPAAAQTEITFAVSDDQVSEFRELARTFHERYPAIVVQVIPLQRLVANDYDGALSRLTQGADAALYYLDPRAAAQGLLYDLAPFIAGTPGFQAQDFYPQTLEAFAWNGGTWGLPGPLSFGLLLYDRAALEQAGLQPPPLDWDQAAFLRAAQALTLRPGSSEARYGFVDFNGKGVQAMLLSGALPQALAQGRLDAPEMVAALRWYVDLETAHQVAPVLSGDKRWEKAQELLDKGQAAMWSDALWNYAYYTGQKGRKLGLALLPGRAGPVAPALGMGYFMSAGTPYPQETWLWLEFLSYQGLQSGTPDAQSLLPARRSVAEASHYWAQFDGPALPVVKAAAEHLSFAPFDPAQPDGLIWKALDAVRRGQTAEQALAEAQQAYLQANRQVAQIQVTPVQVARPDEPRPGAAQIKFFNTWMPDDVLYRSVERFEKENPQIQVKLLDYREAGPQDADCFGSANTIRDTYNLLPLLEADPALKAQFFPSILKAFQAGDAPDVQLPSLPHQAMPRMIHYNKALFDAAGVAYPRPEWTMEDFLAAARALTRNTAAGRVYGYVPSLGENDDLLAFAAAQGVSLWDEQGRPRFDRPEAAAVVQWYADLALKHKVMPVFPDSKATMGPPEASDLTSAGIDARNALIRNGQAAMWAEYYPYNAADNFPIEQLGWAPWPGGVRRATVIFYDGLSIARDSQQVDACWQWIKFLTGDAEVTDSVPARQDVQSAAEYLKPEEGVPHAVEDLPVQRYVLENYSDAYTYHHVDPLVRPIIDSLLADIYNGVPVTQALAKAQQVAQQGTPTPWPIVP